MAIYNPAPRGEVVEEAGGRFEVFALRYDPDCGRPASLDWPRQRYLGIGFDQIDRTARGFRRG